MNKNRSLYLVYTGGFLLAMHYALVAYVNSSLLNQFVSNNSVLNTLYIIGSLLSIFSLYLAPILFKKYGSIFVSTCYLILEIVSVFGMGRTDIGYIVLILFLLHQSGESMLTLSLDVHLEQEIKDEHTTGRKRGTFLTISNLAWVISPLLVSFLVKDNDFSNVYLLSSIILIPLLTLTLFYFKNGKETNKKHLSIIEIIKSFRKGGDTVRVIGAQFMLQFFFSWMTIYLPLLLSVEIGFEWQQIGLIFTIMLLPFLLFEIPAGALGDKKWGEKELLKVGFLIMSITTFLITYIDTKIFFVWAILLFITRVGASIVEISSESYFFKHVKEDDTDLISIFRMSRPFSFVFAPLIALPIVYYTSYSTSFAYLAIFTLLGLVFIPKKDTR